MATISYSLALRSNGSALLLMRYARNRTSSAGCTRNTSKGPDWLQRRRSALLKLYELADAKFLPGHCLRLQKIRSGKRPGLILAFPIGGRISLTTCPRCDVHIRGRRRRHSHRLVKRPEAFPPTFCPTAYR